MTVQKSCKVISPGYSALLVLLLLFAPSIVFATNFELARLSNQIELLSSQLADDLRYTRNYGSLRQRAVTLSREASQLGNSLRRNYSSSRVRSHFKDVRRSYEKLEQAFFRANKKDHEPRVYQDVNQLSNLFSSLSDEYHYAGYSQANYGTVYMVPHYYVTPGYNSTRGHYDRANSARHNDRKATNRRDPEKRVRAVQAPPRIRYSAPNVNIIDRP
jgi:hypothetical protein